MSTIIEVKIAIFPSTQWVSFVLDTAQEEAILCNIRTRFNIPTTTNFVLKGYTDEKIYAPSAILKDCFYHIHFGDPRVQIFLPPLQSLVLQSKGQNSAISVEHSSYSIPRIHLLSKEERSFMELNCLNISMAPTFSREMLNSTQNFQLLTLNLTVNYGIQSSRFEPLMGSFYFIYDLDVSIIKNFGDIVQFGHQPSTEDQTVTVNTASNWNLGFSFGGSANPALGPVGITPSIGFTGGLGETKSTSYVCKYFATDYSFWPFAVLKGNSFTPLPCIEGFKYEEINSWDISLNTFMNGERFDKSGKTTIEASEIPEEAFGSKTKEFSVTWQLPSTNTSQDCKAQISIIVKLLAKRNHEEEDPDWVKTEFKKSDAEMKDLKKHNTWEFQSLEYKRVEFSQCVTFDLAWKSDVAGLNVEQTMVIAENSGFGNLSPPVDVTKLPKNYKYRPSYFR